MNTVKENAEVIINNLGTKNEILRLDIYLIYDENIAISCLDKSVFDGVEGERFTIILSLNDKDLILSYENTSAKRLMTTNSEFIAIIADKLRIERKVG